MKKNKIIFGTVAGLVVLFFAGRALYKMGAKDALEKELLAVNQQLQSPGNGSSQRGSSSDNIKLLAKRKVLQDMLAKM